MSVTLSPPNQLGFPRPLTVVVKRSLVISNPHSSPVAFKVKTTAPKQYCVRPNQGRVEPGENVEVQIVLQALSVDPPPHAKCKDKFLVQSTFIAPDEEIHSLPDLWSHVEKTNKAAIHEQKIRCAYLPAEDGSHPSGIPEENEDTSTLEHSKIEDSAIFSAAETSSPTKANGSGERSIPAVGLAAAGAGAAGLATAASTTKPASDPAATQNIPSLSAADVAAVGASPTDVALEKSLANTTTDSEKLAIALLEIDRLKAQLAEAQGPNVTGLRKRGNAGGAAAEGTATKLAAPQQQTTQGVPVEVVAGLVFAVFVLTYLFF